MLTIAGRVWAVTAALAEDLRQVHEARLRGREPGHQSESGPAAAAGPRPAKTGEALAVVPIMGLLTHRGGFDSYYGRLSSTAAIQAAVTAAAADGQVSAILLEVDSPGGQVNGVEEAATAIRAARAVKPIVAVANTEAGSAAYYLAAQADELYVTPSGDAGSIGVYGMHEDWSTALEQMGVKVTYIYAGKYKVEGNPYEPLTDEARSARQVSVDHHYEQFVRAVAKGRKVTVEAVRGGFGQGRMLVAQAAVEAGLANGVATVEEAERRALRLGAERRRRMASLAQAQADLIRLGHETS